MATRPPRDDVPDDLKISAPKQYAAGVPAVRSSLKHAYEQMGVKRSLLTLVAVNQKKGFDCPGCAWPEGDHRHAAEFCENGAKAVAEEATLRRVTPEFFAEHSTADLAGKSDYWLGQQGRLTHPMYKPVGSDHYRPVGWDEAFEILATELNNLDSPDEALFYTSGRTSNEAAFLYQLFVRLYGTNNLPDCSNMCHESSGSALGETIGIGKGTVSLEDIHQADLLIVAGQNPGTNHPRMLSALEKAKKGGAKIITVNPLPEAGLIRFKNPQYANGVVGKGTSLTDQYLQIRLSGDLALFRALNRLLLEAEDRAPGTVLDRDFIAAHTHGFAEFEADVRATPWADVLEATGLAQAQIEEMLTHVLASKRVVVCWAMGLTQHKNSVPTIREVVNFLLLRGNVGRTGAGVCPVRGHSNVQGDRTMGINEKPPAWFLDKLGAEFSFTPPREHGYDVVEAIEAMAEGKAKVFLGLGGNFISATPDTAATVEAMRGCRLTAHISTKLNKSHAITGDHALILPTLGRTERDAQSGGAQIVSVEDSMGMVHGSRGSLPPASGELLSEVAIVSRLAQATLDASVVADAEWQQFEADYGRIRDRIENVIPGFEDFNARLDTGFALPNGPRDSRSFATATGKANFTVNALEVLRIPAGRLILQTVRSHDQYNTTVYGLDDRYRGIKSGRRVVFVNPDDLAELGFADGQMVDLVSEWAGDRDRRAESFRIVSYPTARGCCAAYFPETNVLVPLGSTADVSNTPTSKSVVVRLEARA